MGFMKFRLEERMPWSNNGSVITELTIANFKAFGETQRVPIRPITLIFGANSSGKSSLIHGLLLARHVWQQGGDPNAQLLRGLAESVDLGGFQQFVFGQDNQRKVRLGMEFSLPSNASSILLRAAPDRVIRVEIELTGTDVKDPHGPPVTASISILNGESELARLITIGEGRLRIAGCRELITRLDRSETVRLLREEMPAVVLDKILESIEETVISDGVMPGSGHLLPRIPKEELTLREYLGDREYENQFTPRKEEVWHDFRFFLSGLSKQFSEPLAYLGPLRYHPPRRLAEPQTQDRAWSSGGGAAWWELQETDSARANANAVLARLGIGCKLDVRRWSDTARAGRAFKELVLVDPHGCLLSARDVGVGVSQVLPVALLTSTQCRSVIAIEQPEIHLHPALQAELGDVFIGSALGERKNTLLLETHSEHLILRVLRRVRETTEGKLPAGATPVRPEDVSVVFVEPTSQGSIVRQLPVTPDGDFGAPWPGGFFAERFQDLP
jgi:hypothetical protein